MKTLTKAAVDERFEKSNIKPKTILMDNPDKVFNKMLHIVIPGDPIADSRPRHIRELDMFYNPHKNSLVKVFERVYKDSILEYICVLSPMRIEIKIYVPVVKKYLKKFSDKDKKSFDAETMYAIKKKDNDNIEKVVFDVLQDDKFMVILRDEVIVENKTSKFFTTEENTRVEIFIEYSDKPFDRWYTEALLESTQYYKFTISPKCMRIHNIPEDKWKSHLIKTTKAYRQLKPKIKLADSVAPMLKKLSTSDIHLLGVGNNREEAIKDILNEIERIK